MSYDFRPFTCGGCGELIDQGTDYAGEIVWLEMDGKDTAFHPRCGEAYRSSREYAEDVAHKIAALCRPGKECDCSPRSPSDTCPVHGVAAQWIDPHNRNPKPLASDDRIVKAMIDVMFDALVALHPYLDSRSYALAFPEAARQALEKEVEATLHIWRAYNDPFACPSCGAKGAHAECKPRFTDEQLLEASRAIA